ncbi:tripartite tricarboxylate transporter permease [Candidatus Micrarchaeota archaeon]|nr:tripartite tricarboxylate transporter permease [Candidatus Micrarchaeota archaeon]
MDWIAFLGGVIFGFLSGFLPGLHANTIISVLSTLNIDENAMAVMIISLYPVHLVTSFIPAIFFGIPEISSVVAVLPGQRMVLRGEGIDALKVILLSCIMAVFISVALFHLSLELFPLVYGAIREHMKFILLGITVLLLYRSRNPGLALLVFSASGMLGYYSLNSGIYDPFLPLFSGMFAIAAIINYQKSEVPEQKEKPMEFDFLKFSMLGVVLGFLADLIPGVGSPSQVATFASIFVPLNTVGYLAAISSISVSEAIFSLATSASIGKSRIGATVWLAETIKIEENLVLLLALFVLSTAIAVAVLYALRKYIAKLASLDFSKMNIILAVYLASITFILDGTTGIFVLTLGGILGLVTIRLGVERINLMGAIIIPTLLLLFRVFL